MISFIKMLFTHFLQVAAWFFAASENRCVPFVYGGCEGNANRFLSIEQCERQCGEYRSLGRVQFCCQSTTIMLYYYYNKPTRKFKFDHISLIFTIIINIHSALGGRYSTLYSMDQKMKTKSYSNNRSGNFLFPDNPPFVFFYKTLYFWSRQLIYKQNSNLANTFTM